MQKFMEKLCYKTLEQQNYQGYLLKKAPVKVVQFGEGNFLRAFVDYFFDLMNEKGDFNGKVCLVQPIATGLRDMINEQEGLYTLLLRGGENGVKKELKRIISSVDSCINPYTEYDKFLEQARNPELKFIASNTTEAGIAFDPACKLEDRPQSSFPGKLTAFLYERYKAKLKGVTILSCELIDHNGKELEKCVNQYADLWKLDQGFKDWLAKENIFCSTLVDRIVTGYPRNEANELCEKFNYKDNLIDTGEIFGFWVIEGPQSIKKELPFEKAGLPIIVVDDHMPYKNRKVRILNGAHTSMVLGAYLCGQDIVRGCMEDEVIQGFMNNFIYNEVIPTLDLPIDDLKEFASAVYQRFNNPYVDHSLLAISLNSTSKWKARVMPTVLEYYNRKKKLPVNATFSFAAYIKFYNTAKEKTEEGLCGIRGKDKYTVKDDKAVLDFYYDHRNDDNATLANAVINNEAFWGDALKKLPGFKDEIIKYLDLIDKVGMFEAIKSLPKD